MKNLKGILFLAAVVMLAMSVNTIAASSSVLMQEVNETSIKRAVFGAFLSASVVEGEDPDGPEGPTPKAADLVVDTALSVTNCSEVIGGPGIDPPKVPKVGDRQDFGAFRIFLVNGNGDVTTHESGGVTGNQGEDWDGILEAGETWTGRLQEILEEEGSGPTPCAGDVCIDSDDHFQGFGWVVSEFDCLAGTYTVTIFGLGFSQSFEFLPGMGQGGFMGGIMLPLP